MNKVTLNNGVEMPQMATASIRFRLPNANAA